MCLTVTLLDGLVLARSAFHHSMNYRSVVILGQGREIEDPERKDRALRAIVEHIVPGRSDDARGPSRKELKATEVIELVDRRGVGEDPDRAAGRRRRGHGSAGVGGRAAAHDELRRAGARRAVLAAGARVRVGRTRGRARPGGFEVEILTSECPLRSMVSA